MLDEIQSTALAHFEINEVPWIYYVIQNIIVVFLLKMHITICMTNRVKYLHRG
jgi:hypothetical protein